MSGMKNLANAIANDPSFAKQAGMSAADAEKLVCDPRKSSGNGKSSKPTQKKGY